MTATPFRRFVAAIVCAFMTLQPLVSAAATASQYRIPLKTLSERGELLLAPDPVDFEDVARTQSRTRHVTITNKGTAPVSGLRAEAPSPFAASLGNCTSLAPGASCTFSATFQPDSAGPHQGLLKVVAANREGTTQLIGNAIPLITDLELSQSGWNFGTWKVGDTSTVKQLAAKNVGNTPIVLSRLYLLEGDDDFHMTHTCGSALAPGATCIISVSFTPTKLGQRLGAFRIKSGDGSIRDVGMLGFGGAATDPDAGLTDGTLAVSDTLSFGAVVLSSAVSSRTLILSNIGGAGLNIDKLTLEGGDAPAFGFTSNCPTVLEAYSTCRVALSFAPTKEASYSTTLNVATSNKTGPNLKPVSLTGSGTRELSPSQLSADVSEIDFGSTTHAVGLTRIVRITNKGGAAAEVAQTYATNSANFVVTSGCDKPLAPGDSCELGVRFTAASYQSSVGYLVVGSMAGEVLQIGLKGDVPAPLIQVLPSMVDFGSPYVGDQVTRDISVTNTGSAPLNIKGVDVADHGAFNASNNCGSVLTAGASCTVTVLFQPQVESYLSSELYITSDDPESPAIAVPLTGAGVGGNLTWSVKTLDFGTVSVDGGPLTKSVSVTNTGPGNVLVTRIVNIGAAFTQTGTCGDRLAANQSCSFVVTYTPTGQGTDSGSLQVVTSGKGAYLALSGKGLTAADSLMVSPTPLVFGSHLVGKGSSASLQVKNLGTVAVSIAAVTIQGRDSEAFVQSSDCVGALQPNTTCSVTVTFTAQQLGAHEATATVALAGTSGAKSINLSGRGVEKTPVGTLSVAPAQVNFADATPAMPSSAVVQIQNSGPDAIRVDAIRVDNPDNFAWDQAACRDSIAAGGSCDLTVHFFGTVPGLSRGTLTLTSETLQNISIPLSGTGPLGRVGLSTNSLNFGSVDVSGPAAAEQSVQLNNVGNADLAIAGIGVQGSYTQRNDCPAQLAPGSSCAITVAFTPQTAADSPGKLMFSTSDPSMPTPEVTLSGTGLGGKLGINATALSFGNTTIGGQSEQLLTLSNQGTGKLALASIALGGPAKAAYTFTSQCPGTLEAGTTCPVTVRFAPQSAGRHEATLTVVPLRDSPVSITLTGDGPVARATTSTTSLAFPAMGVGDTSDAQQVVLTNIGEAPMNVYGAVVVSGEDSFGATSDCPTSLSAGGSCVVYVAFTPSTGGARNGVLRINSANSAGPLDVALSGTGLQATAALDRNSYDFGSLAIGDSGQGVVRVSNTSAYKLKVFGVGLPDNTGFQQTNDCGDILAGGRICEVLIVASPLATGPQSTNLVVSTSVGSFSVPLSMTGTGVTVTRVTPQLVGAAGGSTFSVLGSGFGPTTLVSVDGTPVTSQVFKGTTELEAIAPAHAPGYADVTVMGANMHPITLTSALKYVGPLSVSSILPASGSIAGGWAATITGSGFAEGMRVTVESQPAAVTSVSEDGTTAVIVVPARASVAEGNVPVAVKTTGSAVTAPGGLSYVIPPASLSLGGVSGSFGNIGTGAIYSRMVTVTNTGALATMLGSYDIAPTGKGLSLGTGGSCPTALPANFAPGAACTLEILASSTNVGTVAASLTVAAFGKSSGQATLDLTASFVTPDFVLSGASSSTTAASGNFPIATALDDSGQRFTNPSRTVYLRNVLLAAGTQIGSPVITITGPDAAQFQLSTVTKASATSTSTTDAGALIDSAKLSATGAKVDDGKGSYPNLGVTVTFAPKAQGSFNAQLNIEYNSGSRAQLPLFGKADFYNYVALGATTSSNPVATPSGDFGTLTFSDSATAPSASKSATYYVVSTSAAGKKAQVTRMRIVGADADSFAITDYARRAAGDPALPATDIAPTAMKQATVGEALNIRITFSPKHTGDIAAQLLIEHNGNNPSPLVLNLTGAGANDVRVEASGGPYIAPIPAFAVVGVGGSVTLDTFVRNTGKYGRVTWKAVQVVGSQDITIAAASLINSANNMSGGSVSVPANTRYLTTNLVGADASAAGASDLRVQLKLAPTFVGSHTANITVFHDGPGGKMTYTVTGEALRAAAALSSSSVAPYREVNGDLGVTSFNGVGASNNGTLTRTMNVVNPNGFGLLKVTRLAITGPDASAFTVKTYPGQPAGYQPSADVSPTSMIQSTSAASLPFTLAFTPQKDGVHAAQLAVYHDGMNTSPILLPLTASGTNNVVLTPSEGPSSTVVEPTPFTTTLVGSSASKNVYLRATGTSGAVTYRSVKLEGSPDITLSSSSLVYKGSTSATSTVYYTNATSATLNLAGANVSSSGYTDLGLGLMFLPTSDKLATVKVTVTYVRADNVENTVSFTLSGSGSMPKAVISGYPNFMYTTTDFGKVSYSSAPATAQSKAVTNYVFNSAGVGTLKVTRMVISGPDQDSFRITDYTNAPYGTNTSDVSPTSMVQSGTNGPKFVVTFKPTRIGLHTAQLAIYHNGSNESPLIFPLGGTGANDATVSVTGTGLSNFPDTIAGSPVRKDLYYSVWGSNGQIAFTGFKIEGSPAFTIAARGTLLRGTTGSFGAYSPYPAPVGQDTFVVAGQDLATTGVSNYSDLYLQLQYLPTGVGIDEAKVTVFHNGPGGQTSFNIRGNGTQPMVQLSGTSGSATAVNGDFGLAGYNGPSGAPVAPIDKTIYARNINNVGLAAITRMQIIGDDASAFSFADWTGYKAAENVGQDVSPSSLKQSVASTALQVKVRFKPNRLGNHTAKLLVYHNGANVSPITVDLSGTGARNITGVFATETTNVAYPPADFRESTSLSNGAFGTVSKTVYFRPVGTVGRVTYKGFKVEGADVIKVAASMSVSATGAYGLANYSPSVSSDSITYVGGDLLDTASFSGFGLQLAFAPTTAGVHRATVTVYHDGPGGQTSFSIIGTAQTEMQLSARPDMLDSRFGATVSGVGAAKDLRVYVRQVYGASMLQLESVILSGTDADQFALTGVNNTTDSVGTLGSALWNSAGAQSADVNAALSTKLGVITVKYAPTRAAGEAGHTATLTVSRPGFASQSVVLNGNVGIASARFQPQTGWTLMDDNLMATGGNGNINIGPVAGVSSGKWYFEVTDMSVPAPQSKLFYRGDGSSYYYTYPSNVNAIGVAVGSPGASVQLSTALGLLAKPSGNPTIFAYSLGPSNVPAGYYASTLSYPYFVSPYSTYGVAMDYDNRTVDIYYSDNSTGNCDKVISYTPTTGTPDAAKWYPMMSGAASKTYRLAKGDAGLLKCMPRGYSPLPG